MAGGDVSPWAGLLTSALALAFVLALAWLVLRAIKRSGWAAGAGSAADGPRVLRAVSLGPRERLVVVQHHDVELLLGVTAAGIAVLDRRPLAPKAEAAAPQQDG